MMDASHSTERQPAQAFGAGFADLDSIIRHVPELVRSRDVRHRVFGTGAVSRFNAAIAVAATHALSSMWFFWFCVALDLKTIGTKDWHQWGTEILLANQQINGGKWNLLGTWSMIAGNNTVQVSADSAAGDVCRWFSQLC